MRVRKAIIPAAGLGTRFLPITKSVPKEMLPIIDKPTIQYIIEEALESGIEEILIITGRGKSAIENHFDYSPELEHELARKGEDELLALSLASSELVQLHFVRQKSPKGLGHAVNCARAFVGDEPFAILLGDDVVYSAETPCLKQLIDVYEKTGGSVLGVQSVPKSEVSKYGIVSGTQLDARTYRVDGLVEKPKVEEAPTNVAILGRYVVTPRVFSFLEHAEPGAKGEIQLTDALLKLSKVEEMYAYDFEGRRYDVGKKIGFLEATVEYALRREDLREEFLEYLKQIVQK